MTYLLTGATGLIGRNIVRALLQSGDAVNYLSSRRSTQLDSRAASHHWERNTTPDLSSVPRLDAVIHLAGEPISQRWTDEVKKRIYSSRVAGTRSLVDAIAKLPHKPSVLIAASAVGYYGDRGEEVLTEDSGPGTGFLADICVDWERESMRAAELGMRVCLIRIPMVLSAEGGALKMMLPPFRFGLGGQFGTGRQWMPWVHINDLVRLFIEAAQNQSLSGPLNADSPQPVRNADFTKILGQAVHRPTIMPVPMFALHAILGDLTGFLTASQRVLPKSAEAIPFRFEYPELGPALHSLLG